MLPVPALDRDRLSRPIGHKAGYKLIFDAIACVGVLSAGLLGGSLDSVACRYEARGSTTLPLHSAVPLSEQWSPLDSMASILAWKDAQQLVIHLSLLSHPCARRTAATHSCVAPCYYIRRTEQ